MYVTDVMSIVYAPTRDRQEAVFSSFILFYTPTYFCYAGERPSSPLSFPPLSATSANVTWPSIMQRDIVMRVRYRGLIRSGDTVQQWRSPDPPFLSILISAIVQRVADIWSQSRP